MSTTLTICCKKKKTTTENSDMHGKQWSEQKVKRKKWTGIFKLKLWVDYNIFYFVFNQGKVHS